MKALAKFLCLGAMLAAIVPAAKADPVNNISFSGGDTYNLNTGDVTFNHASVDAANGIFSPFANAAVTFYNFNYMTTKIPFDLVYAKASSTLSAYFEVMSLKYTVGPVDASGARSLDVRGVGEYFVSNGTTIPNGTFDFTTQGDGDGTVNVSFSDTNSLNVTPEPNSLMLLGTGLVSTAGMLLRRRRNASVIA